VCFEPKGGKITLRTTRSRRFGDRRRTNEENAPPPARWRLVSFRERAAQANLPERDAQIAFVHGYSVLEDANQFVANAAHRQAAAAVCGGASVFGARAVIVRATQEDLSQLT
jgi:hypothetical protein